MSNHEDKFHADFVHILFGLSRTKDGEETKCIRMVEKTGKDVDILEAKLRVLGGEWRIHRTVNARDCQKALKKLLHTLIDHPEKASYIDSAWRTALLQNDCVYGDKLFMLDVDTKDEGKLAVLDLRLQNDLAKVTLKIESPGGWHYITRPFDTRDILKLDYVKLLRDGYYFVRSVKPGDKNV